MFKDDDKVVQVAMQIVISAGDARNAAGKALDCVAAFDFAGAKEHMEEANNHICAAHNAQTEMIQSEIAGTETIQPSLLFNHAQDTLMTVMSEIHLAEKMIQVFESSSFMHSFYCRNFQIPGSFSLPGGSLT